MLTRAEIVLIHEALDYQDHCDTTICDWHQLIWRTLTTEGEQAHDA
jgi:hypothetical protein